MIKDRPWASTMHNSPIAPDKSYHVYNAFIDFHGFCDIFAERIGGGKGIQDLKHMGQRIVHAAANIEAPVNLGGSIGAACAMVGFDSGESSFKMFVKPTPDTEMRTVGSSHYKGDIYIDLLTNWVKKVTMYELVVVEVTLPMPTGKINSVIERDIIVRNVSAAEFARR